MKKISNIYKTGLLIIVMSIGMYGCEDFMDKVNEDTILVCDGPSYRQSPIWRRVLKLPWPHSMKGLVRARSDSSP